MSFKNGQSKVRVRLRNDLDSGYDSTLEVHKLSSVERWLNGFATLGVCWIGAVLCILIPVLHFVLVPAGFFAGFFGFLYKFAQTEKLESGKIRCVSCNHEMILKPASFSWPKKEMCSSCGTELVIEPAGVE